ncbi:MAG: N-acetylmuramoyl-L-alanine amidase [Bacteroidota bacterium]
MLLRGLVIIGLITAFLAVAPPPTYGFNASLRLTERKATILPQFSNIRTVVIDAGHGGRDPGCLGGHSREKHIVLGIAQRFAAILRLAYPELEVILTRDEDVFIPLHERAAIANRARADLFISIHANFMPGSQATRGSETYVMGLHTAEHNLNVAKRENEAILLEEDYEANYDYDPNSDEGHILMAMVQSAYLDQSILFAEQVEHQFAEAGRRSRGVKQAGFVVLKETAMPSVLVETGFLSNRSEEAYLLSTAGQEEVAYILLEAFKSYRQLVEGAEAPVAELSPRAFPDIQLQPIGTTAAPDPLQERALTVEEKEITAPPVAPEARTTTPAGPIAYTRGPQAAAPAMESATPSTPAEVPVAEPAPIVTARSTDQDRDLQARELVATPNRPQRVVPASQQPAQQQLLRQPVQRAVPGPVRELAPSTSAPSVVTEYQFEEAARAREILPEDQYDFGVQLAASSRPLLPSNPQWAVVREPIREVNEGGLYKYQVRQLPSAAAALALRAELRQQGFPEAFVVVYHGTAKLEPTAVRELLQQ